MQMLISKDIRNTYLNTKKVYKLSNKMEKSYKPKKK